MSNWLGFSLTPHLRVEEGFGREDRGGYPVMPLRSDGSLYVVDPYRRHSNGAQDWRYENPVETNNASEEGPKLEDFLGCYSNSDETKVYCQEDHTPNHAAGTINMNVAPSFNVNAEMESGEDLTGASTLIQSYRYHENIRTLAASGSIQPCDSSSNPDHNNGIYHVPFESGCSVSGFKSWLRQAPCSGEKPLNETSNSNFQSLSLTMSPSSQTELVASSPSQVVDNRKRAVGKFPAKEAIPRKSIDTFGQRTSQYRGVTRHRWTGRYEAHLWDNSCRKEGQTRKGRQVYLGGYDKEEKAARAYDLAALKYWGPTTHINFPLSTYEKELEEMKHMTRQEFVANLRRKSSGFSRGASVYRGVTRHHQHGRWQARIGRVAGNKDLYLGTFSTQEEAAEAYDIAAIKFRGTSAVTNFGISRYDVKRICSSSTLIAGDLAKRSSKETAPVSLDESNSRASSASPQSLLALTNGEASDDLVDMVWNASTDEHQRQQHSENTTSNDVTSMASSGKNSSSNPLTPKCSGVIARELGIGGEDYSQGYFSLQGHKHEYEAHGGDHPSNNNRDGSLDLVHQVPMFALWNEQG